MKKSILIQVLFSIVFTVGFYGIAFSGGAEGGSCCPPILPTTVNGPFIQGDFTAARDKTTLNTLLDHYNFQVVLRKGNMVHALSGSLQTSPAYPTICDYPIDVIKQNIQWLPCQMCVGELFGMVGTPVIADLTAFCDFAGDPTNAMLYGQIVIGVVLPPK